MRNAPRALKGTPSRVRAGTSVASVLAVLALTIGLTACGESSKGGTPSQQNAAAASAIGSTSSSGAGPSGESQSGKGGPSSKGVAPHPGPKGFNAMRECLSKNGITLPTPPTGPNRTGHFLRGANQLPKGVTRAKMQAALKKCGGGGGFLAGRPGFRRTQSPVFRQALAKYAACLRQNGVKVPAPNTSGKGPVFSTKGIDTKSSQFKAATLKCRSVLLGAFRAARPAH